MMLSRSQITGVLTNYAYSILHPQGITLKEVSLYGTGVFDLLCFKGLYPWDLPEKEDFELWGIEIKSCREDFISDKKWWKYLNRGILDRFTFIAPYQAVTPEDLDTTRFIKMIPPEARGKTGLYAINPNWIQKKFDNNICVQHEAFGWKSHKVLSRTKKIIYTDEGKHYEKQKKLLKRKILARALSYYFDEHTCPHCKQTIKPWVEIYELPTEQEQQCLD